MNKQPVFEGAELTIYTDNGDDFSIPLEPLALAVMLKAIGFHMDGSLVEQFSEDTLHKILTGKINPFRLTDIS